jgi:hypothetical protein
VLRAQNTAADGYGANSRESSSASSSSSSAASVSAAAVNLNTRNASLAPPLATGLAKPATITPADAAAQRVELTHSLDGRQLAYTFFEEDHDANEMADLHAILYSLGIRVPSSEIPELRPLPELRADGLRIKAESEARREQFAMEAENSMATWSSLESTGASNGGVKDSDDEIAAGLGGPDKDKDREKEEDAEQATPQEVVNFDVAIGRHSMDDHYAFEVGDDNALNDDDHDNEEKEQFVMGEKSATSVDSPPSSPSSAAVADQAKVARFTAALTQPPPADTDLSKKESK